MYLHLFGIFIILGNSTLFLYVAVLLPFHRKISNIVVSGFLSACTAVSLVAYFASLSNSDNSYSTLIALVVMIVGFAVGGKKDL